MSTRIEVKLRNLTDYDYCDRCSARAQVLVQTKSGELLFCGHHAAEHAPMLIAKNYPTTSRQEK